MLAVRWGFIRYLCRWVIERLFHDTFPSAQAFMPGDRSQDCRIRPVYGAPEGATTIFLGSIVPGMNAWAEGKLHGRGTKPAHNTKVQKRDNLLIFNSPLPTPSSVASRAHAVGNGLCAVPPAPRRAFPTEPFRREPRSKAPTRILCYMFDEAFAVHAGWAA